ncbi:hypothetical protein EMIT093MI4_240014 [Pseudomonas sp. IT-93MI4]
MRMGGCMAGLGHGFCGWQVWAGWGGSIGMDVWLETVVHPSRAGSLPQRIYSEHTICA